MIKNIHGESEESLKSIKETELKTYMKKKSKLERLKSKKVFPSDEDKYEVNIFSLKISPDFSLFKKLVEATGEDLNLDLFKSLQSDEDSFNIQINSIKKSFETNKTHPIKSKDKILTNSTNSTRKESNSDEISDRSNGSAKKEKLSNESKEISPEEQSNVLNLSFLNLNSKHESINIITDRIIHEVYLDLSLNTNPFVDYILYERQINKMMKKEKELVPTLVKSLLNSFSLLVKDRASKLPLHEKFKNQKKDQEGNYLFNSNDYKILIDIHWFYEIIIRLIRQIREILEAPLNIFNKICKIDVNFDFLLKEIFYDLVFYKEIACLITHAEYNIFTPSFEMNIVKKFSDETTKLMNHTQLKKINELLNPDKKIEYSYFEFITNLRKSIYESGNEKVSDLKICIDEKENKTENQVIHVTVEKKETDVKSTLKKNHQNKSIDELYNFIVSNENGIKAELKSENFRNKNPQSNPIKKTIKRKITKKKNIPPTQTPTPVYNIDLNSYNESPQLNEMFMIEDPTVDNFKKTLAFQSINANTVKKIKPNLKKEWLSPITY